MKVVVTGTRRASLHHLSVIRDALESLPSDTILAHGDCIGTDTIADRLARSLGFTVHPYPVHSIEWNTLGPAAGPLRNQRMLDTEKPDLVLAFPDKESRGTQDMIRRAKKAGIPVKVVNLEDAPSSLVPPEPPSWPPVST